MTGRAVGWLAARYAVALLALVVFLFPLYWLVVTAFKTPDEILAYPPVWWPSAPEFDRFAARIEGSAAPVIGSLVVALTSTMLAVVIGTAAAYATARAGLSGRLVAGWALATRMAPPAMIAVAAVAFLGRGSGLVALIGVLTVLNVPFVLWMMRSYVRDVPVALEEAAQVAGLSRNRIPLKVTWPIVREGLAATTAFTFLLAWNELVLALLLTGDSATTLPVHLAGLGDGPEHWDEIAAVSVVAMLPPLAALAMMPRRLVRTLSLGLLRD